MYAIYGKRLCQETRPCPYHTFDPQVWRMAEFVVLGVLVKNVGCVLKESDR